MKITQEVEVELDVDADDLLEEVLSECTNTALFKNLKNYVDIDMVRQMFSDAEILEHLDKDEIMDYAITHCSKLGKNLQGED